MLYESEISMKPKAANDIVKKTALIKALISSGDIK